MIATGPCSTTVESDLPSRYLAASSSHCNRCLWYRTDTTLVEGNKRLGWLATATFLEINGARATAIANDDVYRLVMHVATGRNEVGESAKELRRLATQ